ncbi:MAG TPA: SPFH domain-containing protein, partial [Rhodopila sp.]|uniref:SPFH domain-containing protein n=1 Tax=Rhodopila sp. TaxID=2480087 RepID=UPI002BFEF2A3
MAANTLMLDPAQTDMMRAEPGQVDRGRREPGRKERAPNGRFDLSDAVKLAFRGNFIAAALLAAGWASGGIREVRPDSRAVVLWFGQFDRVMDSGLALAWPPPIEQVVLVPTLDREIPLTIAEAPNAGPSAEIDFRVHQPDDVVSLLPQKDAWNGQYFLTGDGSVVQFQGTMYYRVTDPAAYVLSRSHVEPALQRLYRASAALLASEHDLDDFLVARPADPDHPVNEDVANRRQALRGQLVAAINNRLAALRRLDSDLGVEISRVDIVVLLPPLAKAAFDDVLTADQTADQTVAAARTDAARTIQEAQRASDRSKAEAQAA